MRQNNLICTLFLILDRHTIKHMESYGKKMACEFECVQIFSLSTSDLAVIPRCLVAFSAALLELAALRRPSDTSGSLKRLVWGEPSSARSCRKYAE